MGLYFFPLGSSRSPGSPDQSPYFHFKVLQETEQNCVDQLGGIDALSLKTGSLGRLLNQPKDHAATPLEKGSPSSCLLEGRNLAWR